MARSITIPELGITYTESADNVVWAYLVKPYGQESVSWLLTSGNTPEGNDFNAMMFGKIIHKEELFGQFVQLKDATDAQLDQKTAQ